MKYITKLRAERRVTAAEQFDEKAVQSGLLRAEIVKTSDGRSYQETADHLGISTSQVGPALRAYKTHGFAAFLPRKGGRQRRFSAEEEETIAIYYVAYKHPDFGLSNTRITRCLSDRGFPITDKAQLNRVVKQMGLPRPRKDRPFDVEEAVSILEGDEKDFSHELFQKALDDYQPGNLDLDSPQLDLPIRYLLVVLEIIKNPKANRKALCQQYHLSETRFQTMLTQFLQFGIEGLIDKPRGRVSSLKVTPRTMVEFIHAWEAGLARKQLLDRMGWSMPTVDRTLSRLQIGSRRPRLATLLQRWREHHYAEIARAGNRDPLPTNYVDEEFKLMLKNLEKEPKSICMPGAFVFAPLVGDLMLREMVHGLGITKENGYSAFHTLLIDVNRKLLGIENINQLDSITDPSLALASGLARLPAASTEHANLFLFDEEKVFNLMANLSRRACDLGLVKGETIALDFHLIEYHGKNDLKIQQWGQGPHTSKNRMINGNRMLLAYDTDKRCPIIGWRFDGKERGPPVLPAFMEKVLDPGIGNYRCRTLLIDAEFPSRDVINYLERRQIRFIIAYKQREWIRETYRELSDKFRKITEEDGREIEVFVMRLKIGETWTDSVLIGYRNREGKIFSLATNEDILGIEDETARFEAALRVVQEYRRRGDIEVEFFEQISDYFLDRHPSTNDVAINLHYFTGIYAQMVYRRLQQQMPEGHRLRNRTLGSLRRDLLRSKNALLQVEDGKLIVRYLDPLRGQIQRDEMEAITALLEGYGEVPHLDNLKVVIECPVASDSQTE